MSNNLTLEHLSNEIFEELFEYFNIYELYKTFSQLNSRIDSIITNLKYLQVILYSLEDINHSINRYFLSKTKTLIINHSNKFYDPINSSLFSHIRCLILCRPTREQWNSIQPLYFPYLERLYLINSTFAYRTEQLCRLILSNGFPYLHTCSLPRVSYDDNNQWTCSLNLQSLEINIWDIRVYSKILDTCPNLIRLKIEVNGGNNQDKFSLINSNKRHTNLRQLSLYPANPITSEFIDSILSFVSNLEYFLLNANHQRASDISIDKLASILEHRTRKLSRIHIDISLPEHFYCKKQIHTKYLLFKSCKIQSELNRPTRLTISGSI